MKAIVIIVLLGLVAGPSLAATGGGGLGDYEVIIQRKPFGEPPPEPEVPVTAAPATPAGPGLADLYKLVAISETDMGLRVGLVETKTSKSYYLRVGELEDGIELIDADYDMDKALIRKGPQEAWLSMGGSMKSLSPQPIGAPPRVPAMTPGSAGGAAGVAVSYAARRRQRMAELEERRRQMAQAPQLPPEELKKHLETYQMELIRSGGEKGPPLPIPLTPEMDDQLVAEGVLPPAEGVPVDPAPVDEGVSQ